MGYRLYFYVVEKKIINKIKKAKTIQEAIQIAHPDKNISDEDDLYTSVYDIVGSYTGFEFGKYLEDSQMKAILGDKPKKLKWFANGDHDCWIGDKDMVKRAAEYEHKRVVEWHRKATESPEAAHQDAHARLRWSEEFLIDLNEDRRELTTSYMYEHQIFNLVSLYKNTDWKKYTVIFAGW